MKKFRLLGLVFCLALLGVSVSALSPLSPGMEVLGHDLEIVKTGISPHSVSFDAADFEEVFGYTEGIVITALPDTKDGILKCGVTPVKTGDVLTKETVSALRFIPTTACKTVHFRCKPDGLGYKEDFLCTVHMLENFNFAPTVQNTCITGKIGIPVFGKVTGTDPENDMLTYHLKKAPDKGSFHFTADGHYRYVADKNADKTDRFTYTVSDSYGNFSGIATVTVVNEKNESGIVYRDMAYDDSAYAASVLAEKGILIGDTVGGEICFHPQMPVSRSDFLVMAMKLCEIDPLFFVGDESPYRDAMQFDEGAAPYILAGTRLGIVKGKDTEDGLVFAPDAIITEGEAATIIGRIAKIKGLPVGKAVAVSLTEDGITDDGMELLDAAGFTALEDREKEVTRADTASLLYKLYQACHEKVYLE